MTERIPNSPFPSHIHSPLPSPRHGAKFHAKREARTHAIDQLVAQAIRHDDCTDRLYWTLIYDFEHAPMTTNMAQLAECGVLPPSAESLNDSELHATLWQVIEALSELGIYLLHSNHLTDRALYERLVQQILVEPVRDLPPDAGVHEFIDLVGGGGSLEQEIYQRYYATPAERAQFEMEHGFAVDCESPVVLRDVDLPKPDRSLRGCACGEGGSEEGDALADQPRAQTKEGRIDSR
ncbi:MAG: hypothetical protein EXS15_06840 [Phycisphaerales bacterium]|nr:hypothetical protein [Phycisphaerales bacterium]